LKVPVIAIVSFGEMMRTTALVPLKHRFELLTSFIPVPGLVGALIMIYGAKLISEALKGRYHDGGKMGAGCLWFVLGILLFLADMTCWNQAFKK
jgi:hypothetical protein